MHKLIAVIISVCFVTTCFAKDNQFYKVKIVKPYKHPIPQQITLYHLTERVSFFSEFGLLFVRAKINDQGPYTFWLDTGSEISLISKQIADDLKLPLLAGKKRHIQASYSKASLNTHLALAPSLNMGQVQFQSAPFLTIEKQHQAHQLLDNLNIAGIIGINMFHGVTVAINLKNNVMVFQKHVIPSSNALRMKGLYFFPVVNADVEHDAKKSSYPFLIDTGFNGGVEMPNCNKNRLPSHQASHSRDFFNKIERGFLVKLKGYIKVGNMTVPNPVVRYAESNCLKKRPFGLIGTQFLKDKIVTINLKKRLISIQ